MSALAEFQNEFSAALLNPNETLLQQSPSGYGAGFAVYQNTVMKGVVDVLHANYPTIARLVGTEWFDAVALRYAKEYPPGQPALALYGASFAAFLDGFATAQGLPYLSSVAQLDRLWTETHFAADAAVLTAISMQAVVAEQLPTIKLRWHAATRVAWLPHSAVSIWQHNRSLASEALEVDYSEQGMLLTRPHGAVIATQISRVDHDFLQRLNNDMTLGEAAATMLEHYPNTDLALMLARMIDAGAFAALN